LSLDRCESACSPLSAVGPRRNPPERKLIRPRQSPSSPACWCAMRMLLKWPVWAIAVPRLHVEQNMSGGTMIVNDRASGERFVIYTPRFKCQFRAGHRACLWYLRPIKDVGAEPRSSAYTSPRALIDALTTPRLGGTWLGSLQLGSAAPF